MYIKTFLFDIRAYIWPDDGPTSDREVEWEARTPRNSVRMGDARVIPSSPPLIALVAVDIVPCAKETFSIAVGGNSTASVLRTFVNSNGLP